MRIVNRSKAFVLAGSLLAILIIAGTMVGFGRSVVTAASSADSLYVACNSYQFARNLKFGMSGDDVRELQKVLNRNPEIQVSATGAGAPGSETSFFGIKTRAAVIKFQELFFDEILKPTGLSRGSGLVYTYTRAKLNSFNAVCPSTGTGSSVNSTSTSSGTSTGEIPWRGYTTIPIDSTGIPLRTNTRPLSKVPNLIIMKGSY